MRILNATLIGFREIWLGGGVASGFLIPAMAAIPRDNGDSQGAPTEVTPSFLYIPDTSS